MTHVYCVLWHSNNSRIYGAFEKEDDAKEYRDRIKVQLDAVMRSIGITANERVDVVRAEMNPEALP